MFWRKKPEPPPPDPILETAPPKHKRTVTCSVCNGIGHTSRKCPQKGATDGPKEEIQTAATPPDALGLPPDAVTH